MITATIDEAQRHRMRRNTVDLISMVSLAKVWIKRLLSPSVAQQLFCHTLHSFAWPMILHLFYNSRQLRNVWHDVECHSLMKQFSERYSERSGLES